MQQRGISAQGGHKMTMWRCEAQVLGCILHAYRSHRERIVAGQKYLKNGQRTDIRYVCATPMAADRAWKKIEHDGCIVHVKLVLSFLPSVMTVIDGHWESKISRNALAHTLPQSSYKM